MSESLSPEGNAACLVVGVGASAGGLESFRRFLKPIPADAGLAFVLIQHLDPNHESLMADLLAKWTEMQVVQVDKPTVIEPNHVYVIPPNRYIKLKESTLLLEEPVRQRGMRMPIDAFFRSLAEARGSRSVCVILSGTGSDGTSGLQEIKAAGGMTLAQTPSSAEYDGMPRSAISSGQVDCVLDIEQMAATILRFLRHPYAGGENPKMPALHELAPDEFQSILALLRAHTDYDFYHYKKGTLDRRIQRRLGLRQIDTFRDYLQLLRKDPEEMRALFKDLLIGVTRFFRDKPNWEVLQEKVIAPLVERKQREQPIRIWVPGCSSGEEAYSIVIAIFEECERQGKHPPVQLFGTDLDEEAIGVARGGLYPTNIAGDLSIEHLQRYFTQENGQYSVQRRLRECVVFAEQNLISDPPFSNLDLVSCRNLLIYLEHTIQEKLMQLFHFALSPGGFLFLGSAESVTRSEKLFEPVSKEARIYQRAEANPSAKGGTFPVVKQTTVRSSGEVGSLPPVGGAAATLVEVSRRALLDAFAPPSVMVDGDMQVRYFHGDLSALFSIPSGEPNFELIGMAKEGIRSKLRAVIRKAVREQKTVSMMTVHPEAAEPETQLRIKVAPVDAPREGSLYLVSFLEERFRERLRQDGEIPGEISAIQAEQQSVAQLEYELRATRADLQSSVEELETSNEELKASNEEVMSMNEELQSTNEELETSREELQSLNEELSTVNTQLEEKLQELEASNNDLTNLLASTEIATLFLDTQFRIRRYTPTCQVILNLIASDVGRPVSDLSPRINDPDLLEDARKVLESLQPIERRLQAGNGACYMRRLLPYRTGENRIDGVVVTVTDVTRLEEARQVAEMRERQQLAVAELGKQALAQRGHTEALLDSACRLLAETLEVDCTKLLKLREDGRSFTLIAGTGWREGLVRTAKVPCGIDSQGGFTLHSEQPVIVEDLHREKRFRGSELLLEHGIRSGMSVPIGKPEEPWGVLGVHSVEPRSFSIDDVHFLQSIAHVLAEFLSREKATQELEDRERRLHLVTDALPVLISYCDRNEIYQYCNAAYQDWFGLAPKDVVGRPVKEVIGELGYESVESAIRRVLQGEAYNMEVFIPYRHGPHREVRAHYVPNIDEKGEVLGYYAMIEDISEQTRAHRTGARLASIVEHSRDAILGMALDGIVQDCNPASELIFGRPIPEIIGQPIRALTEDEAGMEMQQFVEAVARGEQLDELESVVLHKDGSSVEVSFGAAAIRDREGRITGISAIARDITDRNRAARKLREFAEKLEERVAERTAVAEKRAADLRGLAEQISNAEQRARKRLAQAIHDDLQQILIAAMMRLPNKGAFASGEELETVGELINEAVDRSRALVRELNPPVLKDGTLSDILAWLSRRMEEQHGLEVEVEDEEIEDDRVDEAIRTLVFEVVRELLFNVVKHAKVDRAMVRMDKQEPNMIRVEILDAGSGFRLDAEDRSAWGYGLLSIQERVEAFSGEFLIESEPNRGTMARVVLPLLKAQSVGGPTESVNAPPVIGSESGRENGSKIRILVVDDHQIVREGLVRILSSEPSLFVVGEAADGEEAVELAMAMQPDLVVMDISMPKKNGIEATREITDRFPQMKVVGLSLYEAADMGRAMLQAGAVDFLQKDQASSGLIQIIHAQFPEFQQ